MRISFTLVAAVSVLALAASPADARKKKREVEREYFAPTVIAQPAAPAANGSIFQTSVGYTPLTSGARATTVGDIITIVLVERTQASKSNSADTSRSGSFRADAAKHRRAFQALFAQRCRDGRQ